MMYVRCMKRINILITDGQHKRLLERSTRDEVSMSEQIRASIDNFLDDYILYKDIRGLYYKLTRGKK